MPTDLRVCYRSLKNYKYQVLQDFSYETRMSFDADISSIDAWVLLTSTGTITFKMTYAWDGPSGPTIDTLNFMRASLVHDGLYQLMRQEKIGLEYRKPADLLLRKICREDGMSRFRSWYVYQAVRFFGAGSARPGSDRGSEPICAP